MFVHMIELNVFCNYMPDMQTMLQTFRITYKDIAFCITADYIFLVTIWNSSYKITDIPRDELILCEIFKNR